MSLLQQKSTISLNSAGILMDVSREFRGYYCENVSPFYDQPEFGKPPLGRPLSLSRRLERIRYQIRHPLIYRRLVQQCAEHKCIFVHIPKCAGSSIRRSIFGTEGGHRNLTSYQTMLPPQLFAECYKFTFVRNPWDRLASAFFFLKNKDLKSNQKWARKNLSPYEDFTTFVRQWVTRENIWTYSHFRPQFQFICLEQNQPGIDYIGFYENLMPDFAAICEKIGKPNRLGEENRNPQRSKDYRQYYTDETRNIVAEAYAEDIALLGYSFDNSSLPEQLAGRDRVVSQNFNPAGRAATK